MGQREQEWIRATRAAPCPVCEKPKYCTWSADGTVVYCMYTESDKPKESGAGLGWIHFIGDGTVPKTRHYKPAKKTPRPRIDWGARVDAMFNANHAGPMRQRLARQLGVSVRSLVQLRVGWGVTAGGSEFSAWPERTPNGKYCGVVTRFDDGSKYMLKGSKHGLYYAGDWDKGEGPVLIPEGGSDTAALLTLGISAIGRFAATGGADLLAAMLRRCKRPLLVVGERDYKPGVCEQLHCCMKCRPGEFGASRIAEKLSKALRRRKVRWCLPPAGGKDVREWLCRTGGTAGQLFNGLELKP